MKKTGVLNQSLSALIAGLGHTDAVVIADAGLSIPASVPRIDLAVSPGIPSFLDVARAVLSEMQISSAIVASELPEHSPQMFTDIVRLLDGVPILQVPHSQFRELVFSARAVVRTGEFTPYANMILVSEVIF